MGLSISHFDPTRGRPGCVITVHGSGFSPIRLDNQVRIDGEECFVVSATPNQLRAIVPYEVEGGKVEVCTPRGDAAGPHDFVVHYHLAPDDDGPPMLFDGGGDGDEEDVDPIGTVRILVVPLTPNDMSPPNPNAARGKIADEWVKAKEYFRQVSYGLTTVEFDILDGWTMLDGPLVDFIEGNGFKKDKEYLRLISFSAKAALDKGVSLEGYDVIAHTVFANGMSLNGYGGGARSFFHYEDGLDPGHPKKIKISHQLNKLINDIVVGETAEWGLLAHELGHNIVSEPPVKEPGEVGVTGDVYQTGNGHLANARFFDLMGNSYEHPLFSGFHMENLGYYKPANIHEISWSSTPFKQEFELVAHGLSENTSPSRFHLIKIKVTAGLSYYVEVRQQPEAKEHVFDSAVPLPAKSPPNRGGVIVTAAVTDTFHMNQRTRFITLLDAPGDSSTSSEPHDPSAPPRPTVQSKGSTVEEPLRKLRIVVVDDDVQARPLVCRVRVEWATIADDAKGAFDLQIEPWDSSYQTPDIWIDRDPFDTYTSKLDPEGRPIGNGDVPKVGETNHIHARVRVTGALGAKDVRVTYYCVSPPGVGDNGNWVPLGARPIAEIPANSEADADPVRWTPVVDQHTCLMAAISPQPGETSVSNNFAQENIATFTAASKSPIDPVISRVAIRNPLPERRFIHIVVCGVPEGWRAQFPHLWVWLDGKAEKQLDLIVIPLCDCEEYEKGELCRDVAVQVRGYIAHDFDKPPVPGAKPLPSRLYPIGGVLNDVRVRRGGHIELEDGGGDGCTIKLCGCIDPPLPEQRVRVVLLDPAERREVQEVKTGTEGEFEATFDLPFDPTGKAGPKEAAQVEEGAYRAWAEIFAADAVADAVSDFVFVWRPAQSSDSDENCLLSLWRRLRKGAIRRARL